MCDLTFPVRVWRRALGDRVSQDGPDALEATASSFKFLNVDAAHQRG